MIPNKLRGLPFTIPGIAVFFISLIILIRSLFARNAYEILLSSAALVIWVILLSAGSWAVRKLAAIEPLWKPPYPLTAASAEDWQLVCPHSREQVPIFFRLHFLVRGSFFPNGSNKTACAVFAETSMPRGADAAELHLTFPLGGFFRGEMSSRLRDVFGFFSFPCGPASQENFKVRGAPCTTKPFRIEALSGAEDKRTKSSSSEERYYMREYTPGDRLRDINWKSSERIDTLITRISPDNQEKITRIEVYFRNYGPSRPGIKELWLLDRAKARLTWFLRSVNEEKASFVFHVQSAKEGWELSSEDEIDAFLEELASLSFSPAESLDFAQGEEDLYVFSTACDTALPAFLLARQGRPLSLFMVQNPHRNEGSGREAGEKAAAEKAGGEKAAGEKERAEGCEYLHLSDFPARGFFFSPSWLLPCKGIEMNIAGAGKLIDYAETRL